MRHIAAGLLVLLTGCDPVGPISIDFSPPPSAPAILPPDDPGTAIEAGAHMSNGWNFEWTANSRLIVPMHGPAETGAVRVTPPRTFVIASLDPVSMVRDTLATGALADFKILRVGAQTGDIYYAYYNRPDPSVLDVSTPILRVPASGSTRPDTVLQSGIVFNGDFHLSADERVLVARTQGVSGPFAVFNTQGSASGKQFTASVVSGLSPDGALVIDSNPEPRVIDVASGTAAWLQWKVVPGRLTHARSAWVNGELRLLLVSEVRDAANTRSTFGVYEWTNGATSATLLGSTEAVGTDFKFCVGWAPAQHHAVFMVDSLHSVGFFAEYAAQYSIISMKAARAKKVGSVNARELVRQCELSPDGAWFAVRAEPSRIRVKRIDP